MIIQHTLSKEEVEKVAVVVLRGKEAYFDAPFEGFPGDCLYILLREGEHMTFLDEADMARVGWVRKE